MYIKKASVWVSQKNENKVGNTSEVDEFQEKEKKLKSFSFVSNTGIQ